MSHRKWVETVNELFIGIGTQTQTIPVQMCSISSSWRIRPDSPLIVWSNAKAWSQQRAAARALRVLLKPWVLAWQGTDCCYKIVTKLYWYDVCIYIYIIYIYDICMYVVYDITIFLVIITMTMTSMNNRLESIIFCYNCYYCCTSNEMSLKG